ncbi:MAG: ATP-binding protein [Desulfosarcinaceae bacterium]
MLKKIDLRSKLFLSLIMIGLLSLAGGCIMIWYTFKMQHLLTFVLEKNIAAYQASAAMENALVNQKGFVTYYFLDGNPDWLRQFREFSQVFNERLSEARFLAQDNLQADAIRHIEQEYEKYIELKQQVIDYYRKGDRQEGLALHKSVRDHFAAILTLCEKYKQMHTESILRTQARTNGEARQLRLTAVIALAVSSALVVFLTATLARQILGPLATLLASATGRVEVDRSGNIVTALGNSMRALMRTADETEEELKKSREHLVQAEKLALVGKLAAGMAHSIRNPFTSVKMRLFTLNRTLKLSSAQKEDFEVISQEIRHIDTIVQNFLEFSRPPKLIMQRVSPSTIVDTTLLLLAHRLKSYNVYARVVREKELPKVVADPEQIKEVLVNLMVNACEAMEDGGSIIIEEAVDDLPAPGRVCLKVSDTGPGIAPAHLEKIFQPFFTTKDSGTGLGLSIARRIMDEHGGSLSCSSNCEGGTCFELSLPLPTENQREHNSNH